MKATAMLLFPMFSAYEISVALSVLAQAEKPVTFFSLTEAPVRSEEALPVAGDRRLDIPLDIDAFDSLLISGSMNPFESYLHEDRYLHFVKQFDRPDMIIGAISSGPILLSMNGMLDGKRFSCGVPEELFAQLRLDPAMHDKSAPFIADGNILTATGWRYMEFGIQFGRMLGLDFSPDWYPVP